MKMSILSGRYPHRLSGLTYLFISLNFLFFSCLLLFYPDRYHEIIREDSYVEYLGFLSLLSAGALLFAAGCLRFKQLLSGRAVTILFFIGAAVLLWASGEEISWGQRIFSIETPELLIRINKQQELNIHNINYKFFESGIRYLSILLIFISTIAFFLKKEIIFGVRVPDTFLIYSFIVMLNYDRHSYFLIRHHLGDILLAPYLVYFIWRREKKMILVTLSSFFIIIFIIIVNRYACHTFLTGNEPNEVREYLFSFLCFIYSLYLFNDARRLLRGKAQYTDNRLL